MVNAKQEMLASSLSNLGIYWQSSGAWWLFNNLSKQEVLLSGKFLMGRKWGCKLM